MLLLRLRGGMRREGIYLMIERSYYDDRSGRKDAKIPFFHLALERAALPALCDNDYDYLVYSITPRGDCKILPIAATIRKAGV